MEYPVLGSTYYFVMAKFFFFGHKIMVYRSNSWGGKLENFNKQLFDAFVLGIWLILF